MAFEDLYQEVLLDHYKNPRNRAVLDAVPEELRHENPTCGDSVKVVVRTSADGRIEEVLFDGRGCAISTASASMMTVALTGKTKEDARAAIELFLEVMRGEKDPEALESLGDVASLQGVARLPVRVKCATLAWHAAAGAMRGHGG